VRDLIESGESSYLEQLRATTPSGLLDLLRVPGLSTAKIHTLHEALGVHSIESLEAAARDGSIAKLPRYGAIPAALSNTRPVSESRRRKKRLFSTCLTRRKTFWTSLTPRLLCFRAVLTRRRIRPTARPASVLSPVLTVTAYQGAGNAEV